MTTDENDLTQCIREVLFSFGQLSVELDALGDTDNLFNAGMTSHANVTVMLGLESRLGIQFPDHMLQRRTFESIASIRGALGELLPQIEPV